MKVGVEMAESGLGFHRKYRPKKLTDYIGNAKNVDLLLRKLKDGKRPQVYLFTGFAGCGKTSFARLVTKEYLCENRNPETGACGVCSVCRAMDTYIETGVTDDLQDVYEIDSADNSGKADMDRQLANIDVPSFDGAWKVYIFDECHMITGGAQNRLLKVLEEPPENVLMILCTTNPEKLLDTIKSRCQEVYTVKKPKLVELATMLKRVCIAEGVKFEDKALGVIASNADFVPRQALILLENVIDKCKEVTYKNTVDVLDVIVDTYYFDFYKLMTKRQVDKFAYIKFLSDLKEEVDLKSFINGLISFTMRGIYISNGVYPPGVDQADISRYRNIFKHFSPKDMEHVLSVLKKVKQNDIEFELLTLGYSGIYASEEQQSVEKEEIPTMTFLSADNETAKDEYMVGAENYRAGREMTVEQTESLSEEHYSEMDEVIKMFGGIILDMTGKDF